MFLIGRQAEAGENRCKDRADASPKHSCYQESGAGRHKLADFLPVLLTDWKSTGDVAHHNMLQKHCHLNFSLSQSWKAQEPFNTKRWHPLWPSSYIPTLWFYKSNQTPTDSSFQYGFLKDFMDEWLPLQRYRLPRHWCINYICGCESSEQYKISFTQLNNQKARCTT